MEDAPDGLRGIELAPAHFVMAVRVSPFRPIADHVREGHEEMSWR
jgi:hypothetical protein